MKAPWGNVFELKPYLWDIYHSIMGFDTPKRFDRIIAILIQLQSKRIVKAQELADRFGVSPRTIYRDIRTLEASGVPIVSEAGIGYSIMEGYRLPPVMFTREEAGSFVAAEKLMKRFTDKGLGAHHESAMYKVKAVLSGKEKDWIDALESHIKINPAEDLFNDIPDALEILFESIAVKKQVFLMYQSLQADEPSVRNIEPVGLFHESNNWYVLGYCHLRKDYRQFRADRILKIQRSNKDYTLTHGTIDDHRTKNRKVERTRVRISIDKRVARYLRRSKHYHGFVSEEVVADKVVMTLMASDLENGFPRWYLTFGDYAEILEPASLRVRVRELLKKMEDSLQSP